MSSTEAAGRFVVFLLSVSVVQGQHHRSVTCTPTQICALKGSTVELRCTIQSEPYYTNVKLYRYTKKGSDILSPQITEQYCTSWSCTVRMTNVKVTDSAVYYFSLTKSPEIGSQETSVNLSVTAYPDLQVRSNPRTVLKCHSSCLLPDYPSYIWYSNGRTIYRRTSVTLNPTNENRNSYSCALKGYEDFPSPPVCVRGDSCNRVIYANRSICVLKGSTVDISCTYNSYDLNVVSKFWFKHQRGRQPVDLSRDSSYSGRVRHLETEIGRSTLRITDLEVEDSGDYRFKFKAQYFDWESSLSGTKLTVTDVTVKESSSHLTCVTACALLDTSSHVWYKNGQKIDEESSELYVASRDYEHSYSCAVKGLEYFPSDPRCAWGYYCNIVKYYQRRICAIEGSSAVISCSYQSFDDPVESKFWFTAEHNHLWQEVPEPQDIHQDVRFSGRVHVSMESSSSSLTISHLRANDSAQYHFKFKTRTFEWRSSLPGVTLTVTALRVQVIRAVRVQAPYTEVELSCHSSCSPTGRFSFVWFTNGYESVEATTYKTYIGPGDDIACAFRGLEHDRSPPVYSPKVPSIEVTPSREMPEGSLVKLTCSSDANPPANYTWYKSDALISEGPQLVFNTIRSTDLGEYHCRAESDLGAETADPVFIDVKYAPKTTSASVSPAGELAEGGSVTLTCSSDANPAASYMWYKNNQTLLQGQRGLYNFPSISSEDKGSYHCESVNQYGQLNSSSLFISVLYAPKIPTVWKSPSGQVVQGGAVSLHCSSDANPTAEYRWYKENEESPRASGQIFTIADVTPEHSGNYYCEAWNGRGRQNSSVHLTVTKGSVKSVAASSVSMILLLMIFVPVVLWVRRRRSFKQPSAPGDRHQLNVDAEYENDSAAAQRSGDEQDKLHYTTVVFSEKEEDPLYSNIRQHGEEEDQVEMDVTYAIVNFKSGGATASLERPRRIH